MFGSFARGDARRTSDLDIGFYSAESRLLNELLAERVPALPTIRPIDWVDFGRVSAEFRAVAEQNTLPL